MSGGERRSAEKRARSDSESHWGFCLTEIMRLEGRGPSYGGRFLPSFVKYSDDYEYQADDYMNADRLSK
jgi:hypothetical protein